VGVDLEKGCMLTVAPDPPLPSHPQMERQGWGGVDLEEEGSAFCCSIFRI
jgi:hypothetical protein